MRRALVPLLLTALAVPATAEAAPRWRECRTLAVPGWVAVGKVRGATDCREATEVARQWIDAVDARGTRRRLTVAPSLGPWLCEARYRRTSSRAACRVPVKSRDYRYARISFVVYHD